MNPAILDELSNFYCRLTLSDLPEEVVAKTRRSLFDFLGVLLVGHRRGVLSPKALAYVRAQQAIRESSLLPLSEKSSAALAAFYMGIASHSVELDDGHRFGTAHPAAAVIPAVIAVAERENSSFSELLMGIVVGYDVMLRTARAVNPSHLKRGFHTTGTAGSLGAAAGVGKLLDLKTEGFSHCIAIGGLQSAGLQEMLHSNPSIKPLQSGKAAMTGVLSGDFSVLGAAGPVFLFEGRHGWFKAMADEVCVEHLIGRLGERWEILKTYTKLYPTCRHCHHAIDLAAALFREGISCGEIKSVCLYTYGIAISEVGNIVSPKNIEEAMFSLPYSIALALIYGTVQLKELETNLQNKEVLNLAEKINIVQDMSMDAAYPKERGARIVVELSNGDVLSRQAVLPKGEFDTPISDKEYRKKAFDISEGCIPVFLIEKLWEVVVDMPEKQVGLADVFDSLWECSEKQI